MDLTPIVLPLLPLGGGLADASRISAAVVAHLHVDLIGIAEAAELLGVTRQAVSRRTGIVSPAHFPPPVARIAAGPIFSRTDVAAWMRDHRPTL